jgi:hypothetical protein
VKLGTITPAGADVYSYAGMSIKFHFFLQFLLLHFFSIFFMLNISLLSK